jgi:hypothetical protein
MSLFLPYWARLVCLCLSVGALSYVAGLALAALAAPAALRRIAASGANPRRAGRQALALRLLPLLLAAIAVGGLCVPSYMQLEPRGDIERVGLGALLAALVGFALAGFALARLAWAAFRSWRFGRLCRRQGERMEAAGSHVLVLPADGPMMALAGILRPQLLMTRPLWERLTPAQLQAGLGHEHAHLRARDNLKRLLLLAAPAIGSRLAAIESAWARYAEWSADDRAVAGDERRSLDLASALLAVARMGPAPRLDAPAASFLAPSPLTGSGASPRDLADRIERLLAPPAPVAPPTADRLWAPACAWTAASALMLSLLLQPATLLVAHRMLELFAR